MRRIIAAMATVALLASSVPAYAGGYGGKHRGTYSVPGKHYGYKRHGGNYYKYGGHYGHKRKHHDYGYYALGALVGGIVIGSLLSQSRYAYSTPTYAYNNPQPILGNCVQTTGTRVEYGRLAEYGGTMCYDRYNRPHVLENSVRFVRYLN
jgi:hypothetical protein